MRGLTPSSHDRSRPPRIDGHDGHRRAVLYRGRRYGDVAQASRDVVDATDRRVDAAPATA